MGKMFSVLRAMDDFEMQRLVIRDQLAAARLPETAERQTCECPSCDYPAQYECSRCGARVCSFDSFMHNGHLLCGGCYGMDEWY